MISRNIFSESEFLVFQHCAKLFLHFQTTDLFGLEFNYIDRQNGTFVPLELVKILFFAKTCHFPHCVSKTVTFTKFLTKMREREFLQFPHCAVEITGIISHAFWIKISWNQFCYKGILLYLQWFDEIFFLQLDWIFVFPHYVEWLFSSNVFAFHNEIDFRELKTSKNCLFDKPIGSVL